MNGLVTSLTGGFPILEAEKGRGKGSVVLSPCVLHTILRPRVFRRCQGKVRFCGVILLGSSSVGVSHCYPPNFWRLNLIDRTSFLPFSRVVSDLRCEFVSIAQPFL
ncbi:hypothetical protein GW17_00017045 [Ensete ventricosum]|nr:hypothetical protein GW17_00017045 [Ensete ventricosum]